MSLFNSIFIDLKICRQSSLDKARNVDRRSRIAGNVHCCFRRQRNDACCYTGSSIAAGTFVIRYSLILFSIFPKFFLRFNLSANQQDPHLFWSGPPSGSSNTYRLVFQTNSTTTPGASAAGGLVKWGASPTSLSTTVAAGCRSYSIADMCGAPANSSANFIAPGFIFDALLTIPATHAAPVYYCISK